jgi:hypothetical protein
VFLKTTGSTLGEDTIDPNSDPYVRSRH